MKIYSSEIIYSEHGDDECFEYKNGNGRAPDGTAIGWEHVSPTTKQKTFFLFEDIKYSECDHDYWDNLELENDIDRVVLP